MPLAVPAHAVSQCVLLFKARSSERWGVVGQKEASAGRRATVSLEGSDFKENDRGDNHRS